MNPYNPTIADLMERDARREEVLRQIAERLRALDATIVEVHEADVRRLDDLDAKLDRALSAQHTKTQLSRPAAAAYLDMSVETFDRYVRPDVRGVRLTGKALYFPRVDLDEWVERQAEKLPAIRRVA